MIPLPEWFYIRMIGRFRNIQQPHERFFVLLPFFSFPRLSHKEWRQEEMIKQRHSTLLVNVRTVIIGLGWIEDKSLNARYDRNAFGDVNSLYPFSARSALIHTAIRHRYPTPTSKTVKTTRTYPFHSFFEILLTFEWRSRGAFRRSLSFDMTLEESNKLQYRKAEVRYCSVPTN